MKFSSNRQEDSAKNLELKNTFPIHIANLDMKPKSSQAYKSHGALSSIRKKGSNDSVSSDSSVVTLKASNKVNTRKTMNPEQLQAFRMMRDRINDTQGTMLLIFLQNLIDVQMDEDCRRIVIRCIEDLLSGLDQTVVTNFLQVVHGLSARALAEARNFTRDGFLDEINEGQEEDGNDINESDIDLVSETSSIGTFSVSTVSNESLDPNRIFDEEKSNA